MVSKNSNTAKQIIDKTSSSFQKNRRNSINKKKPKFTTFDPRYYQDPDNQGKDAVIWTTKSIEMAKEAISNGQKLKKSPFFDNNPELKKGKIVFKTNDTEYVEKIKCVRSIHYFANKYCKLKNEDSLITSIRLRDYQSDQLKAFLEHNKHIMLWSRQAAKTTTTCIYILHQMTFQTDKLTAILGNHSKTSKEVLRKIKEIHVHLPFWLQAGIMGWNETAIAFDNGCAILSRPCTYDALNGLTVYILYIDEFAYCFQGIKEKQSEFLSNAQPVLAAIKNSRLIITSTPNGKDLFCEMFDKAVKGLSKFRPTKIYWWQIPGRDREWALEQIGDIGEDKFKVQFELSFDVSAEKLLSVSAMRKLDKSQQKFVPIHEHYEKSVFIDHPFVRMHPRLIDSYAWQKNYYVNTADLAEGLGGDADYTTMHGMKICHKWSEKLKKNLIYFRQDFIYENNEIGLDGYSFFMARLINKVLKQDNIRYLIEANKYGEHHRLLLKSIGDDPDLEVWTESMFKSRRSIDTRHKVVGVLTNKAIKPLSVKAFKKAIEGGLFIITDDKTIEQINYFQKDKKGNYEAEIGHDDLVTPLLQLAWIISSKNKMLHYMIEDYLTEKGLDPDEWVFLTDITSQDKYTSKMLDE